MQPSDVTLVQGSADDFEFLRDVHHAAMRDSVERATGSWVERYQTYRLKREFSPENLRIIESGGLRLGTITLTRRKYGLHIDNFYLWPVQQGRGTGSKVLSAIVQQADENGWELRLSCLAASDARRLYERFGFVVTERKGALDRMRRLARTQELAA